MSDGVPVDDRQGAVRAGVQRVQREVTVNNRRKSYKMRMLALVMSKPSKCVLCGANGATGKPPVCARCVGIRNRDTVRNLAQLAMTV